MEGALQLGDGGEDVEDEPAAGRIGLGAGGGLGEDTLAPGGVEGIELSLRCLVARGDAGVADQHGSRDRR